METPPDEITTSHSTNALDMHVWSALGSSAIISSMITFAPNLLARSEKTNKFELYICPGLRGRPGFTNSSPVAIKATLGQRYT